MRYWAYVDGRVVGPFQPDELAQLPSFDARSTVCPETKRGDRTTDWERAGSVADLARLLDPRGGPRLAPAPPVSHDTALRAFADRDALQTEVSSLKGSVSRLQDELGRRDAAVDVARREVLRKSDVTEELHRVSAALEADEAELKRLRDELAHAQAQVRGAEAAAQAKDELTDELNKKADELQRREDLTKKVSELEKSSEQLRKEAEDREAELARLRDEAAQHSSELSELRAKADKLAGEAARSHMRQSLVENLSHEVERLKAEHPEAAAPVAFSPEPPARRPPPPPIAHRPPPPVAGAQAAKRTGPPPIVWIAAAAVALAALAVLKLRHRSAAPKPETPVAAPSAPPAAAPAPAPVATTVSTAPPPIRANKKTPSATPPPAGGRKRAAKSKADELPAQPAPPPDDMQEIDKIIRKTTKFVHP